MASPEFPRPENNEPTPNNPHKNQKGAISEGTITTPVDGVNPDRVKFVDEPTFVDVLVSPRRQEREQETIIHRGNLTVELVRNSKVGTWFRGALAAALVANAGVNLGVEHSEGNEPLTTNAERVQDSLETVDMETMVNQVREKVCSVIDADFMERFHIKNEKGEEQFNAGAFIIPFAVEITSECRAKVDVEVHVPYDFARTFSEISAKNPERREEMVNKLAEFIRKQVENKLVIRGVAGTTDSTLVYDRVHNTISGSTRVDLGELNISDVEVAGTASTEAKASRSNAGPESMINQNNENEDLAFNRLTDSLPLIREAFAKAGVSPEVLKNMKSYSYEQNLFAREVRELAAISRSVLGEVAVGSDEEMAYQLVQEVNAGNPSVLKAVAENPEFAKKIKELITDNRGVSISFEAETLTKEHDVYNIVLPWPLLLLSLGYLKFGRIGGYTERISKVKEYPAVMGTELVNMPTAVARRLFSETTPDSLAKERDFVDVYNSVDLSASPADTKLLVEHMILEEVLPSLEEGTKEPMIDYELIVNNAREYFKSSGRKWEESKGTYPTTEEGKRAITEALLSMWERHDAAAYPMQGIDVKEVLNYRHSPKVMYWAKALAEYLASIAEKSSTSAAFREALLESISLMRETRQKEGGTDRNLFVKSEPPLKG